MDIRIPLTALALVMTMGAPAVAQQLDGGALTCAEFKAMDAAGKNVAMNAVMGFAKESVNASVAGTVASMVERTDDEVFMGRMDAACVEADGTSTVIAAMQE